VAIGGKPGRQDENPSFGALSMIGAQLSEFQKNSPEFTGSRKSNTVDVTSSWLAALSQKQAEKMWLKRKGLKRKKGARTRAPSLSQQASHLRRIATCRE
jgi:hypothetical protein